MGEGSDLKRSHTQPALTSRSRRPEPAPTGARGRPRQPRRSTTPGAITSDEDPILGAVLVGGESRRMGRDKARLTVGGEPLAERISRLLEAVVGEVVLVTRSAEDPRFADRLIVADRFPGRGPLAGLHAALEAAGDRAVLLAACDLPNLSLPLLRHLIGEGLGDDAPRARVPRASGQLQPLLALYSAGCRSVAAACLEAGELSMHGFLERIDTEIVPITPDLPFYRPDLFTNLNYPEDLEAL